MKRLVYAPRVEALIRLESQNRLIDVTEDIISGSVSRKLNAMSTAQLQLQNKYGKYTSRNIIQPMDRIVIRMSRMGEPFLVFSGFIDESPYDQLYPGPVNLAASDTIKLLQHTYFDPGLFAVQGFLQSLGWTYNLANGQLTDNQSQGRVGNLDHKGGVGDVLREFLVEIGGWPRTSIDIHNLPPKFISDITNVMSAAAQEASDQWEENFDLLERLYGISIEAPSADVATPGTTNPGNVSLVDTARAAIKAGFKGEDLVKIVAVTIREGGGRSNAMSYNGQSIGSYGSGLWQIDSQHTPGGGGTGLPQPPGVSPGVFHTLKMPSDWNAVKGSLPSNVRTFMENCFDPVFCAQQAYTIYQSSGIGAWFGYANVTADDMAAATKAIKDVQSGFSATSLLVTSPTTSTASTAVARQSTQNTVATKLLQVATEELGNMEQTSNWSPRISEYLRITGIASPAAWCAAFVAWCFNQAGRPIHTEISGIAAVASIQNYAEAHGWVVNQPKPGDIITFRANDGYPSNDHTGIVTSVSNGVVHTIEGNTSNGVRRRTYSQGAGDHTYIRVPGTGDTAGDGGYAGGTDVATVTPESIAKIAKASIFSLQLQSSDPILSNVLKGRRALANDVPLIEWVQTLTESSGRVFCTKPNGDFLSFHPDRFGYFNSRTPYFQIADVEVVDLNITKNDRELTTHVFTTGSMSNSIGQINIIDQIGSMYATVEDPAFKYFIGADIDPISFLKRYGARPMQHPLPLVNHPMLLWMASWTKFAEQWSMQYSSAAQFTFMPELLPGGLVAIGDRLQMFIEEVTHSFDLGGGFTSQATLSSPASLSSKYSDLPIAGLPARSSS
jgi:hypothetical protein